MVQCPVHNPWRLPNEECVACKAQRAAQGRNDTQDKGQDGSGGKGQDGTPGSR